MYVLIRIKLLGITAYKCSKECHDVIRACVWHSLEGVTHGLPDVGGGEVSDQKWSGARQQRYAMCGD